MTPPVAESSYDDAQPDPRPTKRARKLSTKSRDTSDNHTHDPFTPPAPVDHIFITDGIVTKKPGGKKVNFTLFPLSPTAYVRLPRLHCRVANVEGVSVPRLFQLLQLTSVLDSN